MANSETADDYHNEYEMCGLYAGGILGGLVIGSFGDLIGSEINSMAFYIGGACWAPSAAPSPAACSATPAGTLRGFRPPR